MGPLYAILLALLLLCLRGVALAYDAALSRVPLERARELAREGRRGAALFKLKGAPEDTAAALRVVQTFTLVFAGGLSAYAGSFAPVPGWAAEHLPGLARMVAPFGGALVLAALTTLTDLVSRALGAASGERHALRLARLTRWLSGGVSPFLRSGAAALELLLKPFGAKVSFAPPAPPLEEIERLLAEEAGKRIDQRAPALIHSIFELSEKSARDVMVPRTEMVAVELTTKPEELIRLLDEEGHSRMPVYKEDVDHIVGVLHARDLVPLITIPHLIVLQDLLRPATFVPWSKPIGELLRDLQKKRIHLAMVVDEYGGVMGLVTLEDILREIVGEIRNEYEADESNAIEPLADGSWLVRATVSLAEFNKAFGVEMPEGEYETLGGYLNSLAGAIPEVGDRFFFAGLQFTVNDRSPKQVGRVRVSRVKKRELPAAAPGGPGGPAGPAETH